MTLNLRVQLGVPLLKLSLTRAKALGVCPDPANDDSRNSRPRHPQVLVKVNTPVDAGIAPVIAALNEFPKLHTTYNSQGGNGRQAYVWFRYGDDIDETAEFVVWLSTRLADLPGVRLIARLSRARVTPSLMVTLRLDPARLPVLAARLREIAHDGSDLCS